MAQSEMLPWSVLRHKSLTPRGRMSVNDLSGEELLPKSGDQLDPSTIAACEFWTLA